MAKKIPLNDKFPIVNPVAFTKVWVLLFDFLRVNSGTGIMHPLPTKCAFYHHCIYARIGIRHKCTTGHSLQSTLVKMGPK